LDGFASLPFRIEAPVNELSVILSGTTATLLTDLRTKTNLASFLHIGNDII